jgi:hypothetical protein
MATLKRLVAIVALLVAMVVSPLSTPAWADPPQQVVTKSAQATAGKVRLEILVVHGTPSGPVDPRVRDLAPQFAGMNLRGFKVLDSQSLVLGDGQSGSVSLAGGRKLELQLVSRTAQAAKVRIQLMSGSQKKLDTTVSIPRNRAFPVAGPPHDGGRLIVPITARY